MSTSARQRGAAAMEFALVFPVIFLLLYGVMSFGALLYVQIAVSRAVQDGARSVVLVPDPSGGQSRDYTPVIGQVLESLAASALAPPGSNGSFVARRAWLEANVRSRVIVAEGNCAATAASGLCATITLRFPYSDADGTRLLPSISLPMVGGTEAWLPDTLSSSATVRL